MLGMPIDREDALNVSPGDRVVANWADLEQLVQKEITWMPGSRLELRIAGPNTLGMHLDDLLEDRPSHGLSQYVPEPGDWITLLVHIKVQDTYDPTGAPITVTHLRPLPFLHLPMPEMQALEIVRRAFWDVVTHESDEWFRVRGQMVFDPHKAKR